MKRILSIAGTRPEAIKMAPVILELAGRPGIESIVCSTGQHREMLEQAFGIFGIEADIDLNVMTPNQSLSDITARVLNGLDGVLESVKPDYVLAQGDTTTVMVAALASFYHRIPFGHVEAGLRTGVLDNPFPEELNRLIADRAATLMFAPTERARKALLAENLPDNRILMTGNTVVDAVQYALTLEAPDLSELLPEVSGEAPLVLVTSHRRESLGVTLEGICYAIRRLALNFASGGFHFVFPVHLNPSVQQSVEAVLGGMRNVHLLRPVDYLTMLHLMRRASLIMTDSGGVQEEAPAVRTPALVMRETTERPEGIDAGCVRLVGTDPDMIYASAASLLLSTDERRSMQTDENPYGDGQAARRIADAVSPCAKEVAA